MANYVLETLNRICRSAQICGIALLDDELLRLAESAFVAVEDDAIRNQWEDLKSTSRTKGQGLSEVADEMIERSGDIALLLQTPRFISSQRIAHESAKAKIAATLETLRLHPEKYIQVLETLILNADAAAAARDEEGLCDQPGPRGTRYQSTFCAAVIENILGRLGETSLERKHVPAK
jgi:hypothetical protein